ncbi:hypothetical protein [Siphonobacter sp. SORGH_AS_1065]|uniref:hypothetical protein n=1 Tax=Siphonobacter sp. SORGH_AS_1065 TaxID=3041795 RepID=UPI002783268E|nr:hypothetical protein [Siphonobacter sp. SORGH_AS_1065]MDQ1090434.1 putative membrane protein YgcG [Siphonobacter sp. SORGH_AS_1065]
MKFSTCLTILSCFLLLPFLSNAQSNQSLIIAPQSEITYRVSVRSDQQLRLSARVSAVTKRRGLSDVRVSAGLPIILPTATPSGGETKKTHSGVSVWVPALQLSKYKGHGYLKISGFAPSGARIQSKSAMARLNSKGGELRIDMLHPNAGDVEITVGNTGKTPMKVDDLQMNATSSSKIIKRSGNETANFTMPAGQPDGDCSTWWSACECWTACDPYNTGGTFGIPVIVVGSGGSGSGSGSGSGTGGGGTGTGGSSGGGGGGGDGSDGGTGAAIEDVPEKQLRSFIARKFNCSTSVPLYVNVGDSPNLTKLGVTVNPDGDYQNTITGTNTLAIANPMGTSTGALIGMTINVSPIVSANASDCEKFVIYGHEMIHIMHYTEHWAEAKANSNLFDKCTEYAAYKWTLDAIAAAPCTSALLTQIKNTANSVLADANQTQNCNWNYNYSCIPKR